MAGLYVNDYRPWPAWVVEGNEEIARRFNTQIGTYRGHADGDPGHDMSGDLAADFWPYDNTKAKHDAVLAWFIANAERIGAIYIITWRRIWSVARAAEGVRTYQGSDPHTGHIHISYGTDPPEEDMEEMATAEEVAVKVLTLDGVIENVFNTVSGTHVSLETALKDIGREQNRAKARDISISIKLDAAEARDVVIVAQLDAILAALVDQAAPPATEPTV